MTLGAMIAVVGVMGVGPSSSATDAPAPDSTPIETAPIEIAPKPDSPATPEDTTKPSVPDTVPHTVPDPKTPDSTMPRRAETTAKARVSCVDEAILIDLANVGTASGTYTISFTPAGGGTTTKVVTIAAGTDQSVAIPIGIRVTGVLDIRSSNEVVMDHRQVTSKCPTPLVTGEAIANCAARQLIVTLRNSGDAAGTYRLIFTPDSGEAIARNVTVSAGATVVEALDVTLPIRGAIDVRSATQVVLDHQRIDDPCSKPSTTGTARFACETNQLIVNLRNDGDRTGTYTLTYTPDGATPVTATVDVPARSEAVFALAVTPPRSGVVDVRSGGEVVIGGRRIEVNCPTVTTTTAPPTTVAPTTTPATVQTTVAVSVAPATTIQPPSAPEMLAATGSGSSLALIAVGLSLFVLGLMLVDLRPAPVRIDRR